MFRIKEIMAQSCKDENIAHAKRCEDIQGLQRTAFLTGVLEVTLNKLTQYA